MVSVAVSHESKTSCVGGGVGSLCRGRGGELGRRVFDNYLELES